MLNDISMLLSGMGRKLSNEEKLRESISEEVRKKRATSTRRQKRTAYSSEGTKAFLTGWSRDRFVDDIIRKVDGKKIKNTSGT